MRAMVIDEWCGAEGIHELDVEPPPLAPDGLLVRVRAAGVNPVDTKVRGGYMKEKLPFHFPLVLGWDVAGVVEQAGPAVTAFKPGDEVYGYIRRHHLQYGTYAEYATAPEGFFAHMPPELSFEEAAAMPLSSLTAHQALESIGLRGGETVFIGGGAGGVGHLAIQLAVARGARVVAAASERNHDFLRELGAEPVDYADSDLPARVRALLDDSGSDAAFDLFGSDAREQAFSVLRPGGRLVSIARPPPEPRDGHHEVHYIYVRPSGYDLGEHITPLIAEGSLRPTIEATYPLEQAAEAHERLEGGHVRGKLVLIVEQE
jgi:NADPH:quinone reductase-like Zn-dependent oxidoreductase